ncbi:MAG: hypothetical protein KDA05_00085 [Phycisphaerales bacterium]|nr:hypothetical protein [Phycisphaerales bacterium]MCB9841549.1 hypothetical protein [Phycisphaeraceae bacterium]
MAESIEARLARLEGEVAALRERAAGGAARLVDGQGRVRGEMTLSPSGPMLCFYDESGAARARLMLSGDGPGLTLADENGNTRAWLGFTKEALRIGFADEAGNSRVFVGVMRSGPVAKIYDEQQRVVWSAP